MEKYSQQMKSDGLSRILIERLAPVLVKTRLALLQSNDRRGIKIKQVLAGLSLGGGDSSATNSRFASKSNGKSDDPLGQLLDTNNPVKDTDSRDLSIEQWLYQILRASSTIRTICGNTDDILKDNWLQLHQQLGLPSLLPLYLFVINVLLDVMIECVKLTNERHMNNEITNLDSSWRQQVNDRRAFGVILDPSLLSARPRIERGSEVCPSGQQQHAPIECISLSCSRDALATRLYTVRMLEQFMPHQHIEAELVEFDECTLQLYTVSFLSKSHHVSNGASISGICSVTKNF